MMGSSSQTIFLSRKQNIILLIIGFLLGQGFLFGSSTYLITQQAYSLSIFFSVCFTTTVFINLIIESGGLVIIARQVVAVEDQDASDDLDLYFSSLVVVRLIVWFFLAILSILYWVASEDPARYYFLPAILGLFFWCFNTAGVFDGHSLSGFSGLSAVGPSVA